MDETLEEAALKWFVTTNKREIIFDLGWIKIFEAGAKWQQERMYSEQEVLHLLDTLWDRLDLWYNKGMECDETEFNLKEWFNECELKKK